MIESNSEDLGAKVRRGVKWSVLERVGLQALQTVFGIALARILLPEDFGLIAMLAVFTAVANYISDGGLSQALVQKKNPTEVDTSTIFFFNITVGSALAIAVFLCSPLVATFYEEPRLSALLRALSFNIILTSFTNVQSWLLNKELEFKLQFKAKIIATVVSSILALILANLGYGPWSLVIQSLTLNGINSLLIWLWSKWRPSLRFSFESLRSMFKFSVYLFISGQLNVICTEAYNVIVGKLFSASQLGIFARAKQTQGIPTNALGNLLHRVSFPAFSMIQDDPNFQLRAVRKSLRTIAFFHFPIILGLAATSESVVELLLTSKWLESAPLLTLFCFAGVLTPTNSTHASLLLSTGDSKTNFKLSLTKNALRGILLSFTWIWGLKGLIYGEIFFGIVSYILHSSTTARILSFSVFKQFSIKAPYLVAAGLMYASVTFITPYLVGSIATILASQILIGAVVFFALCHVMKLQAYIEYRDVAKNKLQHLFSRKNSDSNSE